MALVLQWWVHRHLRLGSLLRWFNSGVGLDTRMIYAWPYRSSNAGALRAGPTYQHLNHPSLSDYCFYPSLAHPTIRPTAPRLIVFTTTSNGRTCTVSCRRPSTSATCPTCPTASSWSATLIVVFPRLCVASPSSLSLSLLLCVCVCVGVGGCVCVCVDCDGYPTHTRRKCLLSHRLVAQKALGALGFYSSLFFVKYIYGSIKCD